MGEGGGAEMSQLVKKYSEVKERKTLYSSVDLFSTIVLIAFVLK